jgi:cytochrome c biogenesis protein CcmG/thiol:disulfide interchange protein DsbE
LKAGTEVRRVACGALVAALLGAVSAGGIRQAQAVETLLNRKAPQFVRRDLNGRSVNLARLRGKVVLLNFWATWCAPCASEMGVFSQWQREYGGHGLQVIGISMDDGEAPVKKLVERLKPEYPIAIGDAKLGERYGGVLGLPLTYLIDRKGVVRARFQGSADLKAMESRIKELLARP